ncbi:hypothetical protein CHUAL_006565 [Chamberlinius hualienensis]
MGANVSGSVKGELTPIAPPQYRHYVSNSTPSSVHLPTSATTDHLSAFGRSAAHEKKRRISGFATLRRKLIRRRRTSKSFDHAKVIKDFVSGWGAWELNALAEEYDAAVALKDLVIQADLARPPASTYKQDMAEIYNYKYCTDVDLLFRGACFPVHRALLSCRCPFFRDLLAKVPGYGAQVNVDIRSANFPYGVDIPTFSALLRYLYTGDFYVSDARLDNLDVLIRLGEEFGTPNPLDHDLRYLLETGEYADCVLVFSSSQDFQGSANGSAGVSGGTTGVISQTGSASGATSLGCTCPDGSVISTNLSVGVGGGSTGGSCVSVVRDMASGLVSEYGFTTHKLELRCHKAILSARSPFFRNLIQRRLKAGEEMSERALRTPIQIVLDDSVIPWQYARVLLQAIYLDVVDMSSILRGSRSSSSLSEVQAIVSGRGQPLTLAEEAMEIYQIGRFLELDILVQGCEDIIVESLTLENLVPILRWSELPHGSAWVHRQGLHFLREEFHAIVNSPVLYELDKSHMISALQSDFLQACELDVLQAVLKWGEYQLMKRMEEREPNLLSHTAHSVAKKGVKKRDLSDVELRDILSELLPLIRVDHILPPNNDILTNAIKRGLVSTPPSHMIGDDSNNALTYRINAWVRSKNNGLYVKPRLFSPYMEEVKALLEDQSLQEMDLVTLRMVRMSHIPDTLYMVDDKPSPLRPSRSYTTSPYNSGLDIVAGAVPIPDVETMQSMLKREQELRQSPAAQRAYSLALSNRWEITRQIQLRVVREFNLPDAVANVLHSASHYCAFGEEQEREVVDIGVDHRESLVPPPPFPSSRKSTFYSRQRLEANSYGREHHYGGLDADSYHNSPVSSSCGGNKRFINQPLPSFVPCSYSKQPEASISNDSHLSVTIPDIAMATASFNQLHLHEGEMELDLGDGANHLSSGPMFL